MKGKYLTRKKLKLQTRRSNSDLILISWVTDERVLFFFLSRNRIASRGWGRTKILRAVQTPQG